jgi:hypothetical protein
MPARLTKIDVARQNLCISVPVSMQKTADTAYYTLIKCREALVTGGRYFHKPLLAVDKKQPRSHRLEVIQLIKRFCVIALTEQLKPGDEELCFALGQISGWLCEKGVKLSPECIYQMNWQVKWRRRRLVLL